MPVSCSPTNDLDLSPQTSGSAQSQDLKWTLAWMWLALMAVEDKNHKEEHSVMVEIMPNVCPTWWLNHQSCWELWLILDMDLDVYIAETTSHYWSVSQQNSDSAMQTKVKTDYCQRITISTVWSYSYIIYYIYSTLLLPSPQRHNHYYSGTPDERPACLNIWAYQYHTTILNK